MGILILSLKQNRSFFTHPKRVAFLFIAVFVLASFFMVELKDVFATEGINQTINFQGRVANTDGTNVADGNYDFVFRLYKVSTSGTVQWTETWNSGTSQVTVTNGIFQVALGTHTSIASLDFNDDSWYLSVEFNGDGEMDPRIRFASVPYAQNAEKVSGLTVTDTTGTFTLADSKTFVVNNGLTFSGTDSTSFTFPSSGGNIVTEDFTQTLTNKTIGSTGLVFSGATTDLTTATDEHLTLTAAGTGDIIFDLDGDTSFILDSFITDANGVLYTNTSGALTRVTETETGSLCLLSGAGASGAPSWGSCPGGSGGSNWVLNSTDGTLSPINNTLDFLIGGTATLSARFAVLGIESNTPSASVSAATSGTGLSINYDGSLQTTRNNTLIIGGDTTGDISVMPGNGSGALNLTGNFDTSGHIAVGSGASVDEDIEGDDSLTLIHAEEIFTSTSIVNLTGQNIDISANPGGAHLIESIIGQAVSASIETGNTQDFSTTFMSGISASAVHGGTSNLPFATGIISSVLLTGEGDITTLGAAGGYFGVSLSGDGSISNAFGVRVSNNTDLGAGSITTGYGILVDDQTGATSDYGIAIAGADTQALWVGMGADNTDSANGIAFGASLDTNLYRSAADTLATDDNFRLAAGTTIDTLTAGTLGIGTTNATTITLGRSGQGITLPGFTGGGSGCSALETNGSGVLTCGTDDTGGGSGSSNWVLNSGAGTLSPINNTLDFLIGGTATASAVFSITNVDPNAVGIPTLTLGPDSSNNMAVSVGATGLTTFNAIGAGSLFAFQDNVSLGIDESANGLLTFFSSGAGETDPTIQANSTGDLLISAPSGVVTLGSGTGDITVDPGTDDFLVDLTDTGDFFVQDNGTTFATFSDSGGLTFAPNGTSDLVITGDADSNLQLTFGAAPAVDMAVISNTGFGTVTTGVDALSIDFTQGDDGDATDLNTGLSINVTSSSGDADGLIGLAVGPITGGAATEYGILIGSGWDSGLIISSGGSTNSGLVYSGDGRPTKTITLSPEYSGAIITDFYGAGTETSITGSMTSDADTTQGTSIRNYYEWNSSETAAQHSYTVAVRVKLPADFDAWATSNALTVSYITGDATDTQSELEVRIYNENDATIVATSDSGNSEVAWSTVTIDDSTLDDGASSEWDASGETAVIYMRMLSQDDDFVRVGDIVLSYLAKF